jgi:hypothetical protein
LKHLIPQVRVEPKVWQNHIRNEGSIFQDPARVILNEARMQQTHIRNKQNQDFNEN